MKKFVNIYTGKELQSVKSNKGFNVKDTRGYWITLLTLKAVTFEQFLYHYMDEKGGVLIGVCGDGTAASLAFSECVQSLETGEIFMVMDCR